MKQMQFIVERFEKDLPCEANRKWLLVMIITRIKSHAVYCIVYGIKVES